MCEEDKARNHFLKHQILLLTLTTFNVFFHAILCQFPFVCAYLHRHRHCVYHFCAIRATRKKCKNLSLCCMPQIPFRKKVFFSLLQAHKIPKFVSCQTRLISSHDLMTLNLKRCRLLILSALKVTGKDNLSVFLWFESKNTLQECNSKFGKLDAFSFYGHSIKRGESTCERDGERKIK